TRGGLTTHGAPVSLPKLKKAYEKGTRVFSCGPLLTLALGQCPSFQMVSPPLISTRSVTPLRSGGHTATQLVSFIKRFPAACYLSIFYLLAKAFYGFIICV
ncbi:unnamed protein product, partial [Staurois parvus]